MCRINAQTTFNIDTIEYARAKAYKKDFKEADRLLTIYSKEHKNVNAMRLHAQVLYWMKAFNRSETVYKNLLKAFPNEQVVKLDYGRMLYEMNKLQRAELLLNGYVMTNPQSPEANILLAYINYWKGHFQPAREKVAVVLAAFPDNKAALAFLKDIQIVTAPYLKLGADFASDDQPLKKTSYNIEAGWYKSWLFSPVVQANTYHFNTNDSTYNTVWARLGNKISFGNTGFSLSFKAGVFDHPAAAKAIFTGGGSVTQKITKLLSLYASTEKIPYQYTSASASIPVTQQFTGFGINFNKSDKCLGMAAYELQHYDDTNKIQTMYVWALIPIIHKQHFKLKAGYAFSHANADNNTFTSSQPLNTLISTTAPGSIVAGYYNPYFTPNNQTLNSILALVEIHLSKKVSFSLDGKVGVLTSSNNPELVFTRNSGNMFGIDKSYYKQSYTPIEFQSAINIKLSDRLTFISKYEYKKLLFYSINQGTISIKYAFS